MCVSVWVGDTLCETLAELTAALGGPPLGDDGKPLEKSDVCLCWVDVVATAARYGYRYVEPSWCDDDIRTWNAQYVRDEVQP